MKRDLIHSSLTTLSKEMLPGTASTCLHDLEVPAGADGARSALASRILHRWSRTALEVEMTCHIVSLLAFGTSLQTGVQRVPFENSALRYTLKEIQRHQQQQKKERNQENSPIHNSIKIE